MSGPRAGEVWHHASAGPVVVLFCLRGARSPVYVVLDDTTGVLVADRWDLAPAGYDAAVEYAMAWREAQKQRRTPAPCTALSPEEE